MYEGSIRTKKASRRKNKLLRKTRGEERTYTYSKNMTIIQEEA